MLLLFAYHLKLFILYRLHQFFTINKIDNFLRQLFIRTNLFGQIFCRNYFLQINFQRKIILTNPFDRYTLKFISNSIAYDIDSLIRKSRSIIRNCILIKIRVKMRLFLFSKISKKMNLMQLPILL
jgi:hypothetical protein